MNEAKSQADAGHSRADQLVKMANDIGDFFKGQGDAEEAAVGVAKHMKSFWTRSMIDKLSALIEKGAPDLNDLPREALLRLKAGKVPTVVPAGGDAG
jgi:formate dehydrogenase subunit delta